MKWKMSHNKKQFTCEKEGYIIEVLLGDIYPMWSIIKDGAIIDEATNHHPVTTLFNKELAAKVQAERVLNQIIKNKNL